MTIAVDLERKANKQTKSCDKTLHDIFWQFVDN